MKDIFQKYAIEMTKVFNKYSLFEARKEMKIRKTSKLNFFKKLKIVLRNLLKKFLNKKYL